MSGICPCNIWSTDDAPGIGSDGTCVFSAVDNLITSDNHFVHFLGIFFHDDSQILALVRDGYGFHPDKRNDQYDVGVFGLYHFEFSVHVRGDTDACTLDQHGYAG